MLHRSAVCLVGVTLATAFAAVPADAQPRRNRPRARTAAPVTQTVTGRLEAGDLQLDDNEYADTLSVALRAGQMLDVELTSTAFDTYLVVLGPPAAPGGESEALGENDDAGSTARSALSVTAARAGRYEVWATSYAGEETGAYRLRLTTSGAGAVPVAPVPPVAPPLAPPVAPAPVAAPAAETTPGACATPPRTAPRRLYAQGVVRNCVGRPLVGVSVSIYGVTAAGEDVGLLARTDAQGRYSMRVPDGFFKVGVTHEVTWQGQPAGFRLVPADGDDATNQDAAEGVVEDFVWRLSGLRPGETPGAPDFSVYGEERRYVGTSLRVQSSEDGPTAFTVPAGATLTLTLTPEGALVDGSTGAPMVFTRTFAQAPRYVLWYPADIPVGVYTASATLRPADGTVEPLGVKPSLESSAPLARTARVPFPASYGNVSQFQLTLGRL